MSTLWMGFMGLSLSCFRRRVEPPMGHDKANR
jgi:hypothetical protein